MRLLRLLTLLPMFTMLGAAGSVLAQTGAGERWPTPTGVDVTLVGPPAPLAPVRDVMTDLLSRDGVTVVWHNADRLRVEDVVETTVGGRAATVVVWVDVSSGVEARIYFRAAAGRRFVIRRVALPGSVGPLAAEEIAQIVQSVLRALATDSAWALSLSEARAALDVPERNPSPAVPSPAPRATTIDVGSALIGQSYAPELAFTGGLEISLAALSRPSPSAASTFPSAFGGRIALGYGFPAHFATGAVGADLQAARLRLALVWEPWHGGRAAIRLGLGGGVDRVAYVPTAEAPGATAAAGAVFAAALGGADATLRFEVSPRFALTAAVLGEVFLERVHFDAYDAAGNLHEVLVPHRLRPGAAIGVEVRP